MAGTVRLRKGGLVHRWWRFVDAEKDLCSLVSKTFSVGMLFLGIGIVFGLMIWIAVISLILKFGWLRYLIGLGIFLGGVGVVLLICYGISVMRKGEIGDVVGAWVAAKRGRYCPKIEFVDKEGRRWLTCSCR